MLTVADGIFVGRGVGSDALAAVNIVAPLFMLTTGLGLMFGIGTSIVASVHLAKGNVKAACLNLTQAVGVSSLVMVMLAALAGGLHPQVLSLLGCSARLMPLATDYLLLLPGCLFLLLQSIGMLLIRLDGSPRYAMMCNVVPALANLALDYLFIFPLGWGIGGAALATSIGTFMGRTMAVWYFLRRSRTLRFWRLKLSPTSLRLTLRNMGYILRLSSAACRSSRPVPCSSRSTSSSSATTRAWNALPAPRFSCRCVASCCSCPPSSCCPPSWAAVAHGRPSPAPKPSRCY